MEEGILCGYVCCNCGKCRGESNFVKAQGTCFNCGHVNKPGETQCEQCGKALIAPPGTPQR